MVLSYLRRSAVLIIVVVFLLALSFAQSNAPLPPVPTLVFMTDFGLQDDAVAICEAVMLQIVPNLRIMDITHDVIPFNILDAARYLAGTTPYYPAGTVFVVVVDPGVGTSRKAVMVKSQKGQYFVLPDNGLMTFIEDRDGIEGAREITNPNWMIGAKISSTFHGRDIFSPAGAHLANGEDWTQAGPVVPKLVRLDLKPPVIDERGITGQVIGLDGPFSNIITNIPAEMFAKLGYQRGDPVRFRMGDRDFTAPFVKTFGDVRVGDPLLFIDSRGRLEFSLNEAFAGKKYGVKPPLPFVVYGKK
ncbi:MAG: SAM-dependent chlorinase/fluorinase [Acidobacteria bacterium]|nr:SAM-dependent chlorinase/fluorinase [Acidobacteriota bacterium]